jgi:hypothetical protein
LAKLFPWKIEPSKKPIAPPQKADPHSRFNIHNSHFVHRSHSSKRSFYDRRPIAFPLMDGRSIFFLFSFYIDRGGFIIELLITSTAAAPSSKNSSPSILQKP